MSGAASTVFTMTREILETPFEPELVPRRKLMPLADGSCT